ETIRAHEAERGTARQQIATEQARQTHAWAQEGDLRLDLEQTRKQLTEADRRLGGLAQSAASAAEAVGPADRALGAQQQTADALVQALRATESRLVALQQQGHRDKEVHLEAMRQSARLQNDVVSFKAQVDNLTREHDRLRMRTEHAAESLASLD